MTNKVTYLLNGYPDRDPDELVCQFFKSYADLVKFREALEGTYHVYFLVGVDYDDFVVRRRLDLETEQ